MIGQRIIDDDGYETDKFHCDQCRLIKNIEDADRDILEKDGIYVCDECAPLYIEDMVDDAKENRFYV